MEIPSLTERLKARQVPDPLASDNRSPEACARRLRLAAQMSDDGIRLRRTRIRREHPDLSDEEVDERLRLWLHDVPPPGYVEGFLVSNPYRFQK